MEKHVNHQTLTALAPHASRLTPHGFTLVEVIVILSVLAILAAIAVPVAFRLFQVTAEDTTREEMANLKDAIVGNPRKLQSTFRSDFGFLGDIGCLPTLLDSLYAQGGFPSFTFDTAKQAGAGWKGPYITGAAVGEEPDEYKKDQWGNDYTYTPAAGPCPLTATLISNGVDGQFGTGDDITLSIGSNETTATVRGTVKDNGGSPVPDVTVEFYSAVNGVLTTTSTTTDASGNYSFASVPFGHRSVAPIASGILLIPGSVSTGGGGTDITFQVANLSTTALVATQMRADFPAAPPGRNYDQIQIDNNNVDVGNNFVSGQVVDLNAGDIASGATTFAAGSASPPLRVSVDNASTQLPDLKFTAGTTRTVELNNFNGDMRGIQITVTFNPGAENVAVTFTP